MVMPIVTIFLIMTQLYCRFIVEFYEISRSVLWHLLACSMVNRVNWRMFNKMNHPTMTEHSILILVSSLMCLIVFTITIRAPMKVKFTSRRDVVFKAERLLNESIVRAG
jgi:hypothetical protein